MNAAISMKRNHQEKRQVLELINELSDSTVKQNQAAVLHQSQQIVIGKARD